MDFLLPSREIETIDAIINNRKGILRVLKRRGQLPPLDTMITFFQDSEWETTMPILMFIIYDTLKDHPAQMNGGIIYRTLPVFLEVLSNQEISDLLNREYIIKGRPRPLSNDDEYSADTQCTIQTTPLSWLIYLCTKNRLRESLGELNCLNALKDECQADINQPFVFRYTGEGGEAQWTQLSGKSILYTAFAFNKISWAILLVWLKARFNDKDQYPFFNIFKRAKGKDRYHVVECFKNMLEQGTITRREIVQVDPEADRTDSPFFLMVKNPYISLSNMQYIITQLTILGFNPSITFRNWTAEESERVGLKPPESFECITPRELSDKIRDSIVDPRSEIRRMENLSAALKTAEELCASLKANTVAIYQGLSARGLPPELQRHILSGLPYEKYLGNIPKAEAAVSAVYNRREKPQSDPGLSIF